MKKGKKRSINNIKNLSLSEYTNEQLQFTEVREQAIKKSGNPIVLGKPEELLEAIDWFHQTYGILSVR